jgi:hypothetical protein
MIPSFEVAMPRSRAKSGPSGITIIKSRVVTNETAASRKMIFRSDGGTWGPGIGRAKFYASPTEGEDKKRPN